MKFRIDVSISTQLSAQAPIRIALTLEINTGRDLVLFCFYDNIITTSLPFFPPSKPSHYPPLLALFQSHALYN